MQNLQEIMEKFELERQSLSGEIKKVTKKLKLLTKKDSSSIDEDYITAEESQFNPDNKTRDIRAVLSSKLPGFMKPTVCSQRKTGPTYQTFEDIQLTLARRKPPSQRAKSVTFPFKADSENNSQCTLFRTSCLGDLNLHNVDTETVYSQDISDCDVKVEEKKTQTPFHERQGNKHRFHNMSNKKKFSQEHLKVDNWLKSREPKSRQIPPIPLAPRKVCSNVQNQSQNFNANDVTTKVIGTNGKKEENIGEGDTFSSVSEVESNKSATKSVDSVITDELIYTRDYFAASLVLEDEIKHQSEIGYGGLADSFDSKMSKTLTLEGSMPSNTISVMVSHQCESTHEFNDLQEENSRFSYKLKTTVDSNIERRRTGPLKFRRALFMENEDQKDGSIYMQFVHPKVETKNRGMKPCS